jgi:hypothetical protein
MRLRALYSSRNIVKIELNRVMVTRVLRVCALEKRNADRHSKVVQRPEGLWYVSLADGRRAVPRMDWHGVGARSRPLTG